MTRDIEKHRAYTNEWRKENKERISQWRKKYNTEHKEENALYKKEYNANHKPENKEMHKRGALKRYSITLEEYNALFEKQHGRCAICGKEETSIHGKTRTVKMLAVDHDHITGKVRGLLCGHCNPGIGNLQDSVIILQKAIDYLLENG